MELVKIFYDNVNIDGIIVGENNLAIKVITTTNKVALIPLNILKKVIPIRNLNLKEEIEVKALLRQQQEILRKNQEIIILQKELEEISVYSGEQEKYISSLISPKNKEENRQNKQKLKIQDISSELSEDGFKALKYLTDTKFLSIGANGEITFYVDEEEVAEGGEPSKEQLLLMLNSISLTLPLIGFITKLFN